MAFKIVGADENSDFPERVETRLAEKFWTTDTPIPEGEKGDTGAKGDKGDKGDPGDSGGGLVEDPTDPGFFI